MHPFATLWKGVRSVWLNGWVFVYELSGCGFESSGSHVRDCGLSNTKLFPSSDNWDSYGGRNN